MTALWRIAQLCEGSQARLAPQVAFFGPGFLATHDREVAIERLFFDLGFVPYGETIPFTNGGFELTDRPTLGADPQSELTGGEFSG